MHREVLREIAGENLSNEESVVEGAAHILDRVGEVKRLNPLENFSGEAGCG